MTIIDQPGKENLIADFLSCIQHEDDTKPVEDTFLDEHLFVVSVKTPWLVDLSNYLETRKIPNHLSHMRSVVL